MQLKATFLPKSGRLATWLSLATAVNLAFWAWNCSVKPPEVHNHQGLFGVFTTYHLPPKPEACDSLYKTQEERDRCHERNRTRIVEPLRGSVTVTRLDNERGQRVPLSDSGTYRVELAPGYYTVCLGNHCSDAMEVRMRTFVAWGGQFPKDSVESILKGKPDEIP